MEMSKCALVTGGASGIGRATALRLAQDGYCIRILDIDVDGANATAAAIRDNGGDARVSPVDLADLVALSGAVKDTVDQEGNITTLVNVAGFMYKGTILDTDPAAWDRLVAINLSGIFHLCRLVLPYMINSGSGVIVNVASAGALVGIAERAAYCATKAGVVGLTRCIAVDHARQGIRANAICPGTTETEWIQRLLENDPNRDETYRRMSDRQLNGKLGQPNEIAAAISFLCSDDASLVNGTAFAVDGGMTAV